MSDHMIPWHESSAREVIAHRLWDLTSGRALGLWRWDDLTDRQKLRYRDAAAVAIRLLDDDWRAAGEWTAAYVLHADVFGGPDLRRSTPKVITERWAQAANAIGAFLRALAGSTPEDVQRGRELRHIYQEQHRFMEAEQEVRRI